VIGAPIESGAGRGERRSGGPLRAKVIGAPIESGNGERYFVTGIG
jgi:hypothetical protein